VPSIIHSFFLYFILLIVPQLYLFIEHTQKRLLSSQASPDP